MRISDWSSDVCSSDLSAWPVTRAQVDRVAGSGEQPLRRTQHVDDVGMGDAVADLSAGPLVEDEAAVLQTAQVTGDVGLRPAHRLDDVADALLTGGEQREDRQTRPVTKPAEQPRRGLDGCGGLDS